MIQPFQFRLQAFALAWLVCCLSLAHGAESKLQPLRYQQPDLVVDLGVGLWAWPLPLDYDNDGDLDLLVACPDKPSNGIYYFENPSQDRQNLSPIFLPAVRVAAAGHNFQISDVNGQPRILKPGFEFPRDPATGHFNFDKPQRVYAQTNVHPRDVRANMWRYVDYDGDGDHDLIVGVGDWTDYGWDHASDQQGTWRNGPLHGYVYWIENRATDSAPDYSDQPQRLQAAGSDIDVYGWPSPNFADFDGDGDLDLICGEFLDGFTWFENQGTRNKPVYAAGRKLIDRRGDPLRMELQMITPTAIDWDQDGDIDLVVGDEDGRVALLENSGEFVAGMPLMNPPTYFRQQADTLKFGALATPFACDWDGDGDQDILCGNTAGQIGLFENLGPATGSERDEIEQQLPKWSAPTVLWQRIMAGQTGSVQGPAEAKWGYTTFSVADWDGDQDLDIIYNSILGRIGLLQREHEQLVPQIIENSMTQWRTTPVAVDFDGDGKLDLLALDTQGYLTLRTGQASPQRIFIDEDNQPLRLNSKTAGGSGRVKLAVVDWDRDGRLDVLVNSQNAMWYRNCEHRDGKVVLKKVGDLADRNVAGHTSAPAICDFDNDGKPDLLVGAENGRIYHIRHDDCTQFSPAELAARPPTAVPAAKFPGFVSEDFVFEQASFPQCHASSLCQTDRGLVVTWFGGTAEKNSDVGIWVSYHDGAGWSPPREWANGIQHTGLRHPCWNPVFFQPPGDSPTLLFFKVGPSPDSWWGEWMVSYDRGRTFRDRRRLPEQIDGPVRCKPVLLDDGRTLLCGSSTEHDGWRVHMEKVELENGVPAGIWKRVGPLNTGKEFAAIQPTILQHAAGRLQILCRTKQGVIASSFSADGGENWSQLAAINLPNPNSGIDVVTLRDGRHLLIYNHLGSGMTGWGRRGLLNLAISDDGLQWRKVGVLEREPRAEFSYPAIIQADDGLVHMTYTWKRERIKHVVVDPEKIVVGDQLSLESWDVSPGNTEP
jgi:predicted neuraminidase